MSRLSELLFTSGHLSPELDVLECVVVPPERIPLPSDVSFNVSSDTLAMNKVNLCCLSSMVNNWILLTGQREWHPQHYIHWDLLTSPKLHRPKLLVDQLSLAFLRWSGTGEGGTIHEQTSIILCLHQRFISVRKAIAKRRQAQTIVLSSHDA